MTSVLGVRVAIKRIKGTRIPVARVSEVTKGQDDEILIGSTFEHVPRGDSTAEIVGDLGMVFASRVGGLNPDVVVVRRAERTQGLSRREGPKLRLLAEGAVVHAAASVGVRVVLLSGQELAQKAGTNKQAMDDAAESLAPEKYKESVAAAMSILSWQPPVFDGCADS